MSWQSYKVFPDANKDGSSGREIVRLVGSKGWRAVLLLCCTAPSHSPRCRSRHPAQPVQLAISRHAIVSSSSRQETRVSLPGWIYSIFFHVERSILQSARLLPGCLPGACPFCVAPFWSIYRDLTGSQSHTPRSRLSFIRPLLHSTLHIRRFTHL